MENKNLIKKYGSLDGLRAFAAIGIVLMHVNANIQVKPNVNILTTTIIPFFTNFTLLFMIISGFSMCCGYYEKFKSNTISPNSFYTKRYYRILPFFALLTIIDVALNHNLPTVYEGFANLTLCFNLLPNPNINVIGVGWFLGIVFLFYLLFPFFVFLLDNKKRAWIVFTIALIYVAIANEYFFTDLFVQRNPGRTNIIWCAPLFISGGLIYLYREKLEKLINNHRTLFLFFCIALSVLYFIIPRSIADYYILIVFLFSSWLIYAIGDTNNKILSNKVTLYISNISMEIYLSHMLIYRIVEKMQLTNYIHYNNLLYIMTCFLTLIGAILFSHCCKYFIIPQISNILNTHPKR